MIDTYLLTLQQKHHLVTSITFRTKNVFENRNKFTRKIGKENLVFTIRPTSSTCMGSLHFDKLFLYYCAPFICRQRQSDFQNSTDSTMSSSDFAHLRATGICDSKKREEVPSTVGSFYSILLNNRQSGSLFCC